MIRTGKDKSLLKKGFPEEGSDFFYRRGAFGLFRLYSSSFLILVIILLVHCSIKNPAKNESFAPELSNLIISETMYLRSSELYPIKINATDPQGLDDVASVRYEIMAAGNGAVLIGSAMRDDGTGGDIIPGDGVFFDSLSVAFAGGQAGSYRIGVVAEDRDAHISDTLYAEFLVTDGEMNRPPRLWNPVFPDSLETETIRDVFLSIQAGDPQGMEDVDSVVFQIYPPYEAAPSHQEQLWDDGTHGDIVSGDSIFSYRNDMREVLRRRGDYTIRFFAVDRNGAQSNAVVGTFYVLQENGPPVLSDITAPDTVSRSTSPPFLLAVQVTDPQGPDDVKIVFFNSTKPDGTPSGGNPFLMYDDGTEGDQQTDDGLYSREVWITPDVDTGLYRFDFLAKDYAGEMSDTLSHIITVVE
jgi:hypothetical protein